MIKVSIDKFTGNLRLSAQGWWESEKFSEISYPAEGSFLCFQIENDSFWFKHRNLCLAYILHKFPPGGFLFDVGGGNGCVSNFLEGRGIDTVLVEPSLDGVKNAKLRGVKHIIHSSVDNAKFDQESIPSIGLFDVLEHIEGDLNFLKLLNNLLISKGRIYITVPAYNFLWSSEDTFAGHKRRYNLKSLKKLVESAGFTVEYSTYLFSILPLPIFLLRVIPSFLGFRNGGNKVRNTNDHLVNSNFFVDLLLRQELKWIKGEFKIPVGSSCLLVARKNS